MTIRKRAIIALILTAFFLSGCQAISAIWPGAKPEPTPTPEPLKELNICVRYEPTSLYLYTASSQTAKNVLQAIYDGPFDRKNNGEMQPMIFEQAPSLSDGTASFTPVSVQAGDAVVDIYGSPTSLEAGTMVFPSGCINTACAVAWDGTSELQMDELSAEFKLIAGLKWSDGETLKASDSVFSFNIDDDSATSGSKLMVDQTMEYNAPDERTIQWRAKPGLVTDNFANYFWVPLPEHRLGDYSAVDLLSLEEANRAPLGWGAYTLSQWAADAYIRLDRNMHYFRMGGELPYYDTIFFRFMDAAQVGQINNEECDILTDSLLDLQNIEEFLSGPAANSMNLLISSSRDVETLAIGIKPASYDDSYYPYGSDRPDIFGDVRTRQALVYCIDQAMITEKLLKGYADPAKSILPENDQLMAGATLTDYSYNPAQGLALLDAVGWRDADQNPQTPLTASYVYNVPTGTPFAVKLFISDAELQGDIAREIAANLSACRIQAEIVQLPAEELYKPAPDGQIFGRQFDLALVPWRLESNFDCTHYSTNEIPSTTNYWLGELTGGTNFYGYSSTVYDQACQLARSAGFSNSAEASERQTLEILSNEVPFIPLFHFPEFSAVSTAICGMEAQNAYEQQFARIEALRDDGACP